jgi:hypothetical protein
MLNEIKQMPLHVNRQWDSNAGHVASFMDFLSLHFSPFVLASHP